ncbi:MAG: VTT domain-containing protein [Lysobacterales bacterium]
MSFHGNRWGRRLTWLLLLLLGLAALLGVPELRDPRWWSDLVAGAGLWPWLLLLALQCACAVLMLPSLPLVLASALLFPEQPGKVLLLALVGVLCSALLIHANAAWLQLDRLATGSRWQQAQRWIGRHGSPALCLWCMAPLLPSDLGCYLAAAAKMPLRRYLPAVLIGESVLCAGAIWGLRSLA